jgi:hypothetical protein
MSARRHFIIPDTQVKPGVPVDHMRWIGQAIREYEPDVLVHLGDHWDFPSLSRWSADGSLEREGQRVAADIAAGNAALAMLEDAMRPFKPRRKVLLRGNHEDRLTRYIADRPILEDAIGFHLLNDLQLGWEVVPYVGRAPGQIVIDGVLYAHYFPNPSSGKPVGGTISNRIAKIGATFVQGHVQGLMRGDVPMATGQTRRGIVAGSCYLHDEDYRGICNMEDRCVVILNGVHDGRFLEMPLDLDYLCRKYEGMGVARYLQRNRRDAKERYTLARGAA